MSDPRKHGYLSNRAGQQAANEKELRDEIQRLRAKLERARDLLYDIADPCDESDMQSGPVRAKAFLRELENGGGDE